MNILCFQVLFSQFKFQLLNRIPLTSYFLTLNGIRTALLSRDEICNMIPGLVRGASVLILPAGPNYELVWEI